MRTLIGELRYAADGVAEFRALEHHAFVVVARKDRFVIRKLAGEDSRNQKPVTDLKKQMAFILGELDRSIGAGGAGKLFHFIHGLFRNENFYFAVQARELLICLRKRQAMTI